MTTGVQKALDDLIRAAETSQSDRNRTLDVCKTMARAIAMREDQMQKADEVFEKQLYAAIEALKRKVNVVENIEPFPPPLGQGGYPPRYATVAPAHNDLEEIERRAWGGYQGSGHG